MSFPSSLSKAPGLEHDRTPPLLLLLPSCSLPITLPPPPPPPPLSFCLSLYAAQTLSSPPFTHSQTFKWSHFIPWHLQRANVTLSGRYVPLPVSYTSASPSPQMNYIHMCTYINAAVDQNVISLIIGVTCQHKDWILPCHILFFSAHIPFPAWPFHFNEAKLAIKRKWNQRRGFHTRKLLMMLQSAAPWGGSKRTVKLNPNTASVSLPLSLLAL